MSGGEDDRRRPGVCRQFEFSHLLVEISQIEMAVGGIRTKFYRLLVGGQAFLKKGVGLRGQSERIFLNFLTLSHSGPISPKLHNKSGVGIRRFQSYSDSPKRNSKPNSFM